MVQPAANQFHAGSSNSAFTCLLNCYPPGVYGSVCVWFSKFAVLVQQLLRHNGLAGMPIPKGHSHSGIKLKRKSSFFSTHCWLMVILSTTCYIITLY